MGTGTGTGTRTGTGNLRILIPDTGNPEPIPSIDHPCMRIFWREFRGITTLKIVFNTRHFCLSVEVFRGVRSETFPNQRFWNIPIGFSGIGYRVSVSRYGYRYRDTRSILGIDSIVKNVSTENQFYGHRKSEWKLLLSVFVQIRMCNCGCSVLYWVDCTTNSIVYSNGWENFVVSNINYNKCQILYQRSAAKSDSWITVRQR